MPKQHHQFRNGRKLSWNVPRLIRLARNLPVFELSVDSVSEPEPNSSVNLTKNK